MGIEIRQATPQDAAAIAGLTRAAYTKWIPVIGREPKPMEANYDEAVLKHRFDLLYVDGTLAALIETVKEADHLLIENVAVSPDFQGRGLGGKLLQHAEKLACEQGYGELRLYTNQKFVSNVELYLHVGYRIDRETVGARGTTVYMSKTVQP
jgi:GNAT superfamily N-acetyltransferase